MPGLIVQTRASDGSQSSEPIDAEDQALAACGEDLIRAITSKDAEGVANALRSAFSILESEPHEEGAEEEPASEEGVI